MTCRVPLCRSRRGLSPGISFHEFPVDDTRRTLWLQRVPIKNSTELNWRYELVCSLHFRKGDYSSSCLKMNRLKLTAVPSVFPGSLEFERNQNVLVTYGCYPPKNIDTVTENSDITVICNIPNDSTNSSETISEGDLAGGQICRLCAKTDTNCIQLFLEEETNFSLRRNILKYLHIEVKENDQFPRQICLSCSAAVEAWHEFASTCYNAEESLKELLHIEEQDFTEGATDIPDQISEDFVEENIEKTKQLNENAELIELNKDKMSDAALVPVQVLHELSVKYMKNDNKVSEQTLEEYKCQKCAVSFDFLGFAAHELNVHSRRVLPCKFCSTIFYDEGTRKMHEIVKHQFENFVKEKIDQLYKECPVCNGTFVHTELNRHLKSHSNFCKFCFQVFSSDKEFKKHKKCHFPSYLCDMCGKMLSTRTGLLNHMENHIKNEKKSKLQEHRKNNFRFTCDSCGLMFHEKYDLKKHMRKHLRKKLVCEICGKVFVIQKHYKLHLNMHSKLQVYKCDMCMKDFKNKDYLSRHLKYSSVHRGNKCEKCGKLFLLSKQLSIHVKDCNPAVLHICHICGLHLKGKNVLYDHILTHNVSKRHKCDFCNKQFIKKANKICHERNHHTGERPYSCVFCDRRFVSKGRLKIHKRIHNLIYKCRYCCKRFSNEMNLEFHEQTHKNTDI